MLTSLALIFIVGMALAWIFEKVKLPRLIGMLLTGILLGPFVLNLLDPSILSISADLREFALVIILIKAGLSLDLEDLKKVGRPAILMSFIPAVLEIIGVVLLAPLILGVSYTEAAIMGAVLGAVSPAVVVPKMVTLMEEGYGTKKSIPQLILAASSLDDVFVIILFTAFVGIEKGEGFSALSLLQIPVSIVSGLAIGILVGFIVAYLFKRNHMRDSKKVIIILGVAFLLLAAEKAVEGILPFSGLLAVMSMAIAIQMKRTETAERLSKKFGKLWIAAEIILFVLVGAAVDIRYAQKAGLGVIGLILVVLVFRSAGVVICMIKTKLNFKEKLFCIISYIPKATVQAAIGAIPLSLGLACGQIVLTVAVVSIIITAPLGALGMDITYKRLLTKEEK